MGGTWAHSPGVGQAAGVGGGGVLEVPCLTGHAVVISLLSLTWQEKGQASQDEWAEGASCPAVSFLYAHGWPLPAHPPYSELVPFLISPLPSFPSAEGTPHDPCPCPSSISLQVEIF